MAPSSRCMAHADLVAAKGRALHLSKLQHQSCTGGLGALCHSAIPMSGEASGLLSGDHQQTEWQLLQPAGLHCNAVLQACAEQLDWPWHHFMHRHDSRSLLCRLCHAAPGALCLACCLIWEQKTQDDKLVRKQVVDPWGQRP